jgi:RNA polymerase sigma-70 factor (ECF subfamily)
MTAVDQAAEQELIERARRGERGAFAPLVERYWDRLYRWLYHLTHDAHAAEDLAQEAFLKALAGLASFRPGSCFRAWLFRIAHNQLANQQRPGRPVRLAFPDELPARGAGPADLLLSREGLALLARAVGRLPAEYRAAFLLRAEEDLSFREIAEVLGTTEETARWRVFKARKKLTETLAAQLDPDRA